MSKKKEKRKRTESPTISVCPTLTMDSVYSGVWPVGRVKR